MRRVCCGSVVGPNAKLAGPAVEAGAIPSLCAAMRARSHSKELIGAGCVALHNLAGLGHAAACREAGAAAIVEAARMQHPTLSHTTLDMLTSSLACATRAVD